MIESRTQEIRNAAHLELQKILEMGGVVAAVENAYMKQQLVESNTARVRAIESGEQTVVGVNAYTETSASPLVESGGDSILVVDESAEREQVERLEAFRRQRNASATGRICWREAFPSR